MTSKLDYRINFLIIAAIVIINVNSKSVPIVKSVARRNDSNEKLNNSNFTTLYNDWKRLRMKKSKDELKHIATVGLVAGAMRVERNMRDNLGSLMKEFYMKFNTSTPDENMERLFQMEEIMERDKRAIQILSSSLDFARDAKTFDEYRHEMEIISKDSEIAMLKLAKKKLSQQFIGKTKNETIENLVGNSNDMQLHLDKTMKNIKVAIDHHMQEVHATIKAKVKETVKYLQMQELNLKKKTDFDVIPNKLLENGQAVTGLGGNSMDNKRIDLGTAVYPLVLRNRRQESNEKQNEIEGGKQAEQSASVEGEGSNESESSSEENPGGILGLIASLSGGDEGSDIGALIGALSGVVTNLFGPGGLDIPSLLSTATGLISGLLAGDENFGKVLASYITTAIDGFSGGGGADLNGQFFGQFIGTLIAGLSADPEDDDNPPKPDLFIQNVFAGSKQATSKAGPDDGMDDAEGGKGGGSDLFGFISNIVSSVVAGITNLIVNASLGSSGGSSQGSADLSAGASAGSSGSSSKPDEMHKH